MSRRRLHGVLAGLSCGVSFWAGLGAARAEDAPPESPPPAFVAPPPGYEPPTQYAQGAPPARAAAETAPTFMTLDRVDATSRFGIQVGWDKLDQTSVSDGFLMRYDLYGQYALPNTPAGVYGQFPLSHAFNLNGEDSGGFGNLEFGGFFMPMHNTDLILRGGLALATGASGVDGLTNVFTTWERLTDLMQAEPSYTALRVSASTLQQKDNLFFRADVGFDLAVNKPAGATYGVFFRGNLGLGVRTTFVDVTAELVNLAFVDGNTPSGIENRFFHTAGLSLRTQGENQFHIGSVFPLDSGARGQIWIISLGYQRAMTM